MIVLFAQSNSQTKPLYLFDLIADNKAVIPFVKTLEINLKGETDIGVPKDRVLTTGFTQLSATEVLSIEQSSRIAKLVLSPLHERSLISMVTLDIKDPLEGFQNPLDPSHYRWLERYRNLYAFELAPCINNSSLHDFISFFPNVVKFDIYERTKDPEISRLLPILERLPDPESMTFLRLLSLCTRDYSEDLSSILPKFKNVSNLSFGPGTLNTKWFDLINYTTFPRLELLCFGYRTDVSTEQLKSLISGEKKLVSLRRLDLALIMKDPDIAGDRDYERDYDMGGWLAPLGFTAKFTSKGMEEIVELADREGMHLEGYAVELARRETESRKKDAWGRSTWERKMAFY
ncbi:hypothetical protein JCM5353_008577 [Sporobolomyces roseus]